MNRKAAHPVNYFYAETKSPTIATASAMTRNPARQIRFGSAAVCFAECQAQGARRSPARQRQSNATSQG